MRCSAVELAQTDGKHSCPSLVTPAPYVDARRKDKKKNTVLKDWAAEAHHPAAAGLATERSPLFPKIVRSYKAAALLPPHLACMLLAPPA